MRFGVPQPPLLPQGLPWSLANRSLSHIPSQHLAMSVGLPLVLPDPFPAHGRHRARLTDAAPLRRADGFGGAALERFLFTSATSSAALGRAGVMADHGGAVGGAARPRTAPRAPFAACRRPPTALRHSQVATDAAQSSAMWRAGDETAADRRRCDAARSGTGVDHGEALVRTLVHVYCGTERR